MRNASSVAAFLLSASILSACGSQPQSAAAPAPKVTDEGVLAVVGGEAITVEDFNAKMGEQAPFIRSRYQSLEKKQEFLDNLVRMELLAQEAERRGLDKDPDVRQATKKMMVQKLMRGAYESADEQGITEEEIAGYYQEHLNDYVKPERVRLSHIYFNVPKADAQRSKVRAEAVKLATEIKAKEAGPNKSAFADVAKERSDDQISKRAGGDLSFRTEQELTDLFGLEVAKAAFALQASGEISQVVETDRGLHVLKLTGRQAPMNRGLEEVKGQIESRLGREKANQSFESFVAGLREKAQIQVNEAALEAVVVDTAPAPGRAPGATGLGLGGLGSRSGATPQVAPTQAEK